MKHLQEADRLSSPARTDDEEDHLFQLPAEVRR